MKYTVKRQHYGDRLYNEGDEREADPQAVAHLVRQGVLVEAKAAPAPKNKAAPAVKNKAK